MNLRKLILVLTVALPCFLNAQQEKTTGHIFTASPSGTFSNLFNSHNNSILAGLQLEYQWKFSPRFSAGIIGGGSIGRSTPVSFPQRGVSLQPEFRYWLPVNSTRFQPFVYANYGFIYRETDGPFYTSSGINRAGAAGAGITGWINNSWGVQGKYDILSGYDGSMIMNVPVSRLRLSVVYRPGQRSTKTNTQPQQ